MKGNEKVARAGGNVAKIAKDDLEVKLGESVISNKNTLGYKYLETKTKIETKRS